MAIPLRWTTTITAAGLALMAGLAASIAGEPPRQQPASQPSAKRPTGRAAVAPRCMATAKTQLEMNSCAGMGADEADAELNRVFRRILERHANHLLFIERLKAAERAWIAFRDAELEARYPVKPGDQPSFTYGSVWPMCLAGEKEALTRKRTDELKGWLEDREEGDVCVGSYAP